MCKHDNAPNAHDMKGRLMTTPALTAAHPVRGAMYDPTRPETRERWWLQRRGGLTATDVRDWIVPSSRRRILTEKVIGEDNDNGWVPISGTGFTLSDYAHHGQVREGAIAEWIEQRFAVQRSNHVYSHPEEPRFLATPDGMYVEPFSDGYAPGTEDAVISEIKTAGVSLQPGPLDAARVLVRLDHDSQFAKERFYRQVQWQMFVMNATRCLFAWEVRTKERDHEAGIWVPAGPPEYCWIPRDQPFIDALVEEARDMLATIDAAVTAAALGELPPVSDLPAEHAVLVAEYLRALDAEAVARKAKEKAYAALKAIYLADDMPDDSIDAGFARITTNTTKSIKRVFNRARAAERAPKALAAADALMERYSEDVPSTSRRLTITAQIPDATA